ncbi:hypothetical protein BGZ74_001627 [Mortierella antarctica]|nr:hypothetical protein BGZ74_001627 [Mortierella antarctica]
MACLVLATDLRPESVLSELFEWAYRFGKLVPLMCRARCWRAIHLEEMVEAEEVKFWVSEWGGGGGGTEGLPKAPLWQYRGSPAFDRILHEILRILAVRKPVVSR